MDSVIVRFPDGSREFRYPAEPLKQGDVIWHESQRYRITDVSMDGTAVVTVELESSGGGDSLAADAGIHLVPLE